MGRIVNKGRILNLVSGLNGVAAGGTAVLNVPVNARYHRITLNTTSAGAAIAVATIIESIKLLVNGVVVRDIDPANILRICNAQGYFPLLGELPLWFSEPLMTGQNIIEPDDVCSWDMAGQSTFQIFIKIQAAAGASPGITGNWEFDYLRNVFQDGKTPFLNPVVQHQFTFVAPQGVYDITTIPFNYPIRRMYFYGTTATPGAASGNITNLEVYQDGNKVMEGTPTQIREFNRPYGFKQILTPDCIGFRNATGPADLALATTGASDAVKLEASAFFDAMFIADPDGRHWKALQCANDLKVRVTSGAAQNVTAIVEYLPGGYNS